MELLKQRILAEGRDLGNGILKVDSFLNHQIDPQLMYECGRALAGRFQHLHVTKVLTAETSGIAPALMTALALQVAVIYARKHKPATMPDTIYLTTAPSHTQGQQVTLMLSPEYVCRGERLLVIDDFLASGQTIKGLVRLALAAGALVIGVGVVIEKTFEGGRQALQSFNVPVEALAVITAMQDGKISFAD